MAIEIILRSLEDAETKGEREAVSEFEETQAVRLLKARGYQVTKPSHA